MTADETGLHSRGVTANGTGLQSHRVYQAQGVVSVQADCSVGDARHLMEERARETGLTLDELATRILEHRIWFSNK